MEKWFEPKRKSGFSKDNSIEENLRTMYDNCGFKDSNKCWLRVGRQGQSLANVTKDPETKKKAKKVADVAFEKIER